MDLGVAQRLTATNGAGDLSGIKKLAVENPAAMRKVAQQFGALLMENVMRQGDGTPLPMAGGVGGDVVNQMFSGTMSRAVMAHEKMGLTDVLLRSLQKKQQQADGGAGDTAPTPPVAAATAAIGNSFPLMAYWQGNGMRPLAAMITKGGFSPAAGAALAMMGHINPKLTRGLGAGAVAGDTPSTGNTIFESRHGRAAGGALAEDAAVFAQKLMPLLRKAGERLGVSPKILLAQAAIETGWGRSVVGNNLFGIKTGSSWTGPKVDAATHEYQNGELIAITDAFRAYPNAEASVDDFVSLVANSPRYKAALGAGDDVVAYAQGLLSGGWATDINYVRKLQSVTGSPTLAAASSAPAGAPTSQPAPADAPGQPVRLLPASFTVAAR